MLPVVAATAPRPDSFKKLCLSTRAIRSESELNLMIACGLSRKSSLL